MADSSGPKCAICYAPAKWCCAFCESNCYCHEHACNHLAKQYPDEFGVKLGPKEKDRMESQHTTKVLLIVVAVVLVFLLLCWIWSQPSNGNSETLRDWPSPYVPA